MAKSTKSHTTPKPVSEKRLAANRANAAHSTGPRTPKAKPALPETLAGMVSPPPPAQISMLRAAQLEASLFTTGINDALADPKIHLENELNRELEPIPGHTRSWLMAEGFRLLCAAKGNDPWRVFLRYQAQAERNYRRALEEFERLKALRNELPNEPTATMQTEPQPEEFKMLRPYDPTRADEPDLDPIEPRNSVPPPSSKPRPSAPEVR